MDLIRWIVAITTLVAAVPLLIVLISAMPLYTRWLRRCPIMGAILALLLAILYGLVGGDLGLKNLFWHEDRVIQLVAGASMAALALLLFFFGFLLDDDPRWLADRGLRAVGRLSPSRPGWCGGRRRRRVVPAHAAGQLRLYLEAMALPVVLLLALPPLVGFWGGVATAEAEAKAATAETEAKAATAEAATTEAIPMVFLPLGAALVFLGVDLVLRVARAARRRWHGVVAALVPILALNLLYIVGPWAEKGITAVMAICLLLSEVGAGGLHHVWPPQAEGRPAARRSDRHGLHK